MTGTTSDESLNLEFQNTTSASGTHAFKAGDAWIQEEVNRRVKAIQEEALQGHMQYADWLRFNLWYFVVYWYYGPLWTDDDPVTKLLKEVE